MGFASNVEINMADTCEESSLGCSDSISSDDFSVYTDSSVSDEDLQNKEPTMSSSSVKKRPRSGKLKNSEKQSTKKTKRDSSTLNDEQMEEMALWIFSMQEASKVEGNIHSTLLELPRVKLAKERERFAKHMLCGSQKANFQLLILGFCPKFSGLLSECSLLTDKANRKAAFSVAWMKMLRNFQPRKATQE